MFNKGYKVQFLWTNLLELSVFWAKLQPVKIWNKEKRHTTHYSINMPLNSEILSVISVYSFFCIRLHKCTITNSTHPAHTLRWPPPFLCGLLPAPSAQRSTGILRSAQTRCSGWDGSRPCSRTPL